MVPDSARLRRRTASAALLAGLVVSVASVGFTLLLSVLGRSLTLSARLLADVAVGVVLSLVWYAPLFLAVLLVVEHERPLRAAAVGVVLVYPTHLALAALTALRNPLLGRSVPQLLVQPLPTVVRFLAIATAIWLAYDGGYDRVIDRLGNPSHPLFAVVADKPLAAGLTVRRGVVATILAALVAVGGLLVSGAIGDAIAPRNPVTFSYTVAGAGISVEEIPTVFAFEAALLLGVLFVTAPQFGLSDLLKGLAVVYGVGFAVRVAPVLLSPGRSAELWAPDGPIVGPLGDALLLLGVAFAVWLLFRGDVDTAVGYR